eukprot:COSAG04_NODE_5234_length_1691_cov_1.807789_2_plen_191_part_00
MLGTIGDEFNFAGGHGLLQTEGSEGFILHGRGHHQRPRDRKGGSRIGVGSWYRFEGGRFSNGLMGLNIALSDAQPGDGGFCCIPGSRAPPRLSLPTTAPRRAKTRALPSALTCPACPCQATQRAVQIDGRLCVAVLSADKAELRVPLEVRRVDTDLGMVQQVLWKHAFLRLLWLISRRFRLERRWGRRCR